MSNQGLVTVRKEVDPKAEQIKAVVLAGSIGVVTAGGLVFGAVKLFDLWNKTSSSKDALTPLSPSSYASRLKLAFGSNNFGINWHTDLNEVYAVFNEMPSQAFYGQVQNEYFKLYGKQLNLEIQNELQDPKEYNKALAILATKPSR